MAQSQYKEKVWYYRQVPYESGPNKGKLHYEYNWKALAPEVDKAIKFFEDEGLQPTVRQIHYHFTQLKPPSSLRIMMTIMRNQMIINVTNRNRNT